MLRRPWLTHLALLLAVVSTPQVARAQNRPPAVADLSLEQLANIEVTTSERMPIKNMKSPAAVYVITQEDIRRSGVTSIPEALRLAPGVQVARIDSNKWAIGVRGFGSRLARSILVMVDGRNVYSPLFAGTYWEVQDTLLEDVERIEVILGPGGTLWGANAVNGVINIITKSAKDTTGTVVTSEGGSKESALGVRYGAKRGDDSFYRAYGKFFHRDALFHNDGVNFDAWQMGQAGFRTDWTTASHRNVTVQGDIYSGLTGQRTALISYTAPYVQPLQSDARLSGGNVLARLNSATGGSKDFTVQLYYDRTNHVEPTFQEARDTFDLDLQQRLFGARRHDLIWGLGYRVTSGDVHSQPAVQFIPNRRTDQLVSGFLQDNITLARDRLQAIVGSKLEHNDYSGFEAQPSARLAWTPSAVQTIFAAASRAVRTPSRVEDDLTITSLIDPARPAFVRLLGNPAFRSEELRAYEVGYRIMPATSLYASVSTFFNQHRRLESAELAGAPYREDLGGTPALIVPFVLGNGIEGESRGVEFSVDNSVNRWWRVHGAYSYVFIDLHPMAGSQDSNTVRSLEGSSPRHQFMVHSSMNLPRNIEVDWMPRLVSVLPAQGVNGIPSYSTFDLRLAWTPKRSVRLSVVGQNLPRAHHPEFIGSGAEVPRSVYAGVTWLR